MNPAKCLAFLWVNLRRAKRTSLCALLLGTALVTFLLFADGDSGNAILPALRVGSTPGTPAATVLNPQRRDFEEEQRKLQDLMQQAEELVRRAEEVKPPAPIGKEEILAMQELSDEEKDRLTKQGYKDNAFNQFVSDRISLHRPLKDPRDPMCSAVKYDIANFPDTSVVVVFHNEARTTLLRTVVSVLDRSPPSLLREIILVDDASTREWIMNEMEEELKALSPKIKLIRLKNRSGLIRAKVFGAEAAKGDVLTFLDSHTEANVGWLEPLLERIHIDRTIVVCPVIDNINKDTFEYTGSPVVQTRGIFTWSLTFSWLDLPWYEQQKRTNPIAPLPSPTMAGGLFSMERNYFFEIGSYDMGMDVWGGENLEMSFRIWQCGGTLEFIPCSRVGHVYRDYHPYKFPNGTGDTINRNLNRVAEVWMDDYKEIYYNFRPNHRSLGAGDIAERVKLRNDLNCKPFKWYLDNVFPDMLVPSREKLFASGGLKNTKTNLCLDTMTSNMEHMVAGLYPCAANGNSENQKWYFTKSFNEIRHEATFGSKCLDSSSRNPLSKVALYGCHSMKGNQEWRHNANGQIYHVVSNMCLQVHYEESKPILVVNNCEEGNEQQKWLFTEYDQYHN